MDKIEVEELLIEVLVDNGFYDVVSFADASLMTLDNGVVCTTVDGQEFLLTISQRG